LSGRCSSRATPRPACGLQKSAKRAGFLYTTKASRSKRIRRRGGLVSPVLTAVIMTICVCDGEECGSTHKSRPEQAGPRTQHRCDDPAPRPPSPSHGYLPRTTLGLFQQQGPHWSYPVSLSTTIVLVYINHPLLSRGTHRFWITF